MQAKNYKLYWSFVWEYHILIYKKPYILSIRAIYFLEITFILIFYSHYIKPQNANI